LFPIPLSLSLVHFRSLSYPALLCSHTLRAGDTSVARSPGVVRRQCIVLVPVLALPRRLSLACRCARRVYTATLAARSLPRLSSACRCAGCPLAAHRPCSWARPTTVSVVPSLLRRPPACRCAGRPPAATSLACSPLRLSPIHPSHRPDAAPCSLSSLVLSTPWHANYTPLFPSWSSRRSSARFPSLSLTATRSPACPAWPLHFVAFTSSPCSGSPKMLPTTQFPSRASTFDSECCPLNCKQVPAVVSTSFVASKVAPVEPAVSAGAGEFVARRSTSHKKFCFSELC
jgi:hypothetical protein